MADQFERVSRVPTKTVEGVTIPDVSFEDGTMLALEYAASPECRKAIGDDALHALIVGSIIIACIVACAPPPIKASILNVAQGTLGDIIQKQVKPSEGQTE